jgi:hypothetical protein
MENAAMARMVTLTANTLNNFIDTPLSLRKIN